MADVGGRWQRSLILILLVEHPFGPRRGTIE